jgi:hypothetical protein
MDVFAWMLLGIAAAVTAILVACAPALKRDQRRRQLDGRGTSGGLGSGLDAVWRPSAEDAHAQWEAQIELPAPAPTPGDGGRLEEGRLVIVVPPAS